MITFVVNNKVLKLNILIVLLVATAVSACLKNESVTKSKVTDMPSLEKRKQLDRNYINHLYGKENDPLKPWLEAEKQHIAIQNGEGC